MYFINKNILSKNLLIKYEFLLIDCQLFLRFIDVIFKLRKHN